MRGRTFLIIFGTGLMRIRRGVLLCTPLFFPNTIYDFWLIFAATYNEQTQFGPISPMRRTNQPSSKSIQAIPTLPAAATPFASSPTTHITTVYSSSTSSIPPTAAAHGLPCGFRILAIGPLMARLILSKLPTMVPGETV